MQCSKKIIRGRYSILNWLVNKFKTNIVTLIEEKKSIRMNKFLVNNIIEVKSLLKTSKINLYFSDIEFEIDGKRIYHMNMTMGVSMRR